MTVHIIHTYLIIMVETVKKWAVFQGTDAFLPTYLSGQGPGQLRRTQKVLRNGVLILS